MEIGKVEINNFRGINSLVAYFNGKNVIIGDSNCGKTTILKALDLALNPSIPYYKEIFSEYDFNNKNIDNSIIIKIVFEDLSQKELDYFMDYIEPGENIDNIKENINDISDLDKYEKYLRIEFKCEYLNEEYDYEFATYYCKKNNTSSKKMLSKKDKYIIGFQLIDPSKEVKKITNLNRNSAFNKIIKEKEVSLNKEIGEVIEEKLPEVSEVIHNNEPFDRIIKELGSKAIDFGFLEDSKENLKFELSNMTKNDLLRKLELFVQARDSINSLPLSYHGTGLQNSISLSTALLLSELNNKGIIAIEEPENGLHPHAQEYLSYQLNNIDSQVIVTTHSPDIAGSFSLKDFLILDKIKNQTNICKLFSHKKGEESIYRYAEKFTKEELVRSLFGKAVLLVEGDTEEGAFPIMFGQLSKEDCYTHYAKLGINIVNVGTCTKLKDYGKVYQELNIPVIAVVDNDPEFKSGNKDKFINDLKNNTDLTINLPEDDVFYDFEGIMCYDSELAILKKSLIELTSYKDNHDRVKGIICNELRKFNKSMFESMIENDINNFVGILDYLIELKNDQNEKEIKKIFKVAFNEFKGTRYSKIWAKNYKTNQIPDIIKELYKKIQDFIYDKKEVGWIELKF